MLAYEFMDTSAKVINAKGTGIVSGFEVLDATATPEEVGGNLTEWAKQSVFAKANYTYDNRYLAEVSLRRDGASNLEMIRNTVTSSQSVQDGTSTAKSGSKPTG